MNNICHSRLRASRSAPAEYTVSASHARFLGCSFRIFGEVRNYLTKC